MQNNNLDLLFDLNIQYLKNQLKGEPVNMQKGVQFEEAFNLCITNARYNGNCLEDLNDNYTLFNNRSNPKSFQIDIVGLAEVKENNDDISTNTEETDKTYSKNYKWDFFKYDFYDENKTVKMLYENITIVYKIKKKQFTKKTKNNINLDLCEKIKEIGKNNATRSISNVFERAKSTFNEEEKIKSIFKEKYDINKLKIYYNELLSFSFILKNRFNHAQKGYPNIIKFSQINGKEQLYFFHATFIREIDGAYKVISNYNLNKAAGIDEKIFDQKKKKNIFVKNDVLLFELKDSKKKNYCLDCMLDNYEVLNGYVKILKNKNEFKDSEFYYIGVQEGEEEAKENDVKSHNIREDKLKIKLFFFHNNKIFGENYNEMNIEKLKILNLLKDEFSEIEKKIEKVDKKFDKKFENINLKANIIIMGLGVLIFILLLIIIILLLKKN